MHELYNTLYSSKVKLNIKKSLNYLQLSNVESQLLATMIILLSVYGAAKIKTFSNCGMDCRTSIGLLVKFIQGAHCVLFASTCMAILLFIIFW